MRAHETDRRDLAFGPAVAKPSRDEDGVEALQQQLGPLSLHLLAVDVLELDPAVVREPAVDERLVEQAPGASA